MSLGAGYGVQGGYDALQQILAQRLEQQRYADTLKQRDFENSIQTRQLNQADELKKLDISTRAQEAQARLQQAQGAEQDRRVGLANALGDQLPAGTFLPPTDPAVGMLRTGGRGGLLQEQTAIQPMGADFQGPSPDATVQQMQQGRPGGFLKTASANQQNTTADNLRADAIAAQQRAYQDAELKIQQQNANTNANKPPAMITVNTVDAQGNPVTRVVPKTAGSEFQQPAPPQMRMEDAKKKDALGSLDQLDQAIESAKDLIGPGAGRISNLEQMAGNADPRIQALGVKMQLAKMKVDAGIGGMRAAASPQLMQRWDNLLANKVTPEGLKAAVQAMREVLGGTAAGAPATSGATVRRYNPATGKIE